jgi:hypothetical protein
VIGVVEKLAKLVPLHLIGDKSAIDLLAIL